jgi:glutamyl-Q tRNA(Asp) synthetase
VTPPATYTGRFAPSPSGPLHAGSLVAAVASYLDARVHHGRWLLRIEDVDEGRSAAGAADAILALLPKLGMDWDGEGLWQSRRTARYAAAAARLTATGHTYPCGCNRREIADSRLGVGPDGAALYPGTCRHGLAPGRAMRSLRLRVPDGEGGADIVSFVDRLAGAQTQALASASGDFVLKRADGFYAYQLAVVVDDAEQGVTDVVRGADLLDSTPRQIYLQRALGVATPRYLHVPVLRDAAGNKLSKMNGAPAVAPANALEALLAVRAATRALGLGEVGGGTLNAFWQAAIAAWAAWLAQHAAN